MKIYVEAYDKNDNQILGNLDGQTVIRARNYKRTNDYKRLRDLPAEKLSLNGRVKQYRFITEQGNQIGVILK